MPASYICPDNETHFIPYFEDTKNIGQALFLTLAFPRTFSGKRRGNVVFTISYIFSLQTTEQY